MEKNDVTSFFFYMWNAWCEKECEIAFKESSCEWMHFWKKWLGLCEKYGSDKAIPPFFAELSNHNRDLLVKRAIQVYDRGSEIL